ncbi:MAG: helix-turn-helix domain-containing protein [Flammeovirgaceae bacterium]|nr:helix-turn-helix domain-containing protein [Flammeovirgaceae bacterium]
MPYRIDLFSIFIFLGIVQALFLSIFFLSKENRQKQFNMFNGFLLISIAACLLEIFLMYTGYIINILHLVDFSEPLALLIGPFFYLYILSLIQGEVKKKTVWMHVAFAIFYTFALIPFLISPIDVKYNAYINAYHPGLPLREWTVSYDPWMFILTEWHTELVLLSLGIYLFLASLIIVQTFRDKKESFGKPQSPVLKSIRNGVLQIASFSILIVIVKIFNKNDTGDHLFAAFAALQVYATSFSVIKRSGFFKQAALAEQTKYKTSSLTADQQNEMIEKLNVLMKIQKPFLKPDFSLTELAQQMNVSVHMLSQAINDGLGKNFFEMTAEYRVEEAKRLLKDQPNIKVEEIAEQVGYNSKSSFNTAFKKITGKTPSEFRG